MLDLSYNSFSGTIPASYCGLKSVRLNNNNLTGSPASLFQSDCTNATAVYLSHNSLSGELPQIETIASLLHLDVSNNRFSGRIPKLPPRIRAFYASHNLFQISGYWHLALRLLNRLEYLDISYNDITTAYDWRAFLYPQHKLLSLAQCKLGDETFLPKDLSYQISSLDLTNTNTKSFDATQYPNLVDLKIASNGMSSLTAISSLPLLSQLDMSNNNFSFDVAIFSDMPLLSYLNARSNNLYGALVLNGLPNLISVDLSDNNLDWKPDFFSIGSSFGNGTLQMLNISRNHIPTIESFDSDFTGLRRGESSSPSANLSLPLTCYQLVFHGATGRSFIFDEDQFNYHQCDCDSLHFGLPPSNCHSCPSTGSSSCKATEVSIDKNYYAILAPHQPSGTSSPPNPAKNFVSLLWNSMTSSSISSRGISSPKLEKDHYRLETEPCLSTVMQTLSGKSDCQGIQITASDMASSNGSVSHLLATQCAAGSEGRLCSRCSCEVNEGGNCWFKKGPICLKCSRVLRLSFSLLLISALAIVLFIVLTVVMFLVLRSKRRQRLEPWKQLALWRGIFYRLHHIVSLGHVSILVTFLQILVAITNWDVSFRVQFLGVLNGDIEGYVVFSTFL